MIRAAHPANEVQRMSDLLDYQILDTEPELAYDDITDLAANMCSTSLAFVSLVDGKRNWFKSRYGTDISVAPRDTSFCGHAIHQMKVFEIHDTFKDERFFDNPNVNEKPGIRFYAGAPLISSRNFVLGTLCVMDVEPKMLTSEQVVGLERLARQVVSQMELHKANALLKKNLSEIQTSARLISQQQEHLISSAKMVALGEMASGMAHEINNPLTVICGKAGQLIDILEKEPLDKVEALKIARTIDKTGLRIAKIVKGLKSFSRNSDSEVLEELELESLLDDTFSVTLEHFKAAGINLQKTIPLGLKVRVRPTQMCQVFLNILSNAYDAVQDTSQKEVSISAEIKGEAVEICFRDSGSGISSSVAAKVMQPFYTTKCVGKGTGLGLSLSKGIVEAHGGTLIFESQTGDTQFIVSLPR